VSRSTVFGFDQSGQKEELAVTANSWRGAAWIWQKLCTRYLNEDMNLSGEQFTRLGKRDADMSDTDYYCWAITQDKVLVGRDMMLTVAEALESFSPGTEALFAQGRAVRKAHEDGLRAVAWWHTSVSEDPWCLSISDEEWWKETLALHEGEEITKELVEQLSNEFDWRDGYRDFDLDRDFDPKKHSYLKRRDA
jgi:hypothetical protein